MADKFLTGAFTRGANDPAMEPTKTMTSLFAGATTIGLVTGNPFLTVLGLIGAGTGVSVIRKNGQVPPKP